MAKKDDNTMLYIGAGLLLFLYLRNKQTQPPPVITGPRIEREPPVRIGPYKIGDTVTVYFADGPPPAPAGTQWYTPPTGAQPIQVTYTLEAKGTSHGGGNPMWDVL